MKDLEKLGYVFGARVPRAVGSTHEGIPYEERHEALRDYAGTKAREEHTPWHHALLTGGGIGGGLGALIGLPLGVPGALVGGGVGAGLGAGIGALLKAHDDASIRAAKQMAADPDALKSHLHDIMARREDEKIQQLSPTRAAIYAEMMRRHRDD